LPVRALIMVQVLFRAQHYPHSVIHEAKHRKCNRIAVNLRAIQ